MTQDFFGSLAVEGVKILRSTILKITLAGVCFLSAMLGLLMYLIRNPEILPPGILKTKVAIAAIGTDWPAYLGLSGMAAGAVGTILFGFTVSWIFGREYGDRTMKDTLALPVSRSTIVASKLIAVFFWNMVSAVLLFGTGLAAGFLLGLPEYSKELAVEYTGIFFGSTFLSILLCPPVAFVSSAGRGVLPGIGFLMLCIGLANFLGNVGVGQYFPWTIPMLYAGAVGTAGARLPLISYVILSLTSIGGVVATMRFWKYADQGR